jgi:hypothetical protein
MPSWRRSASARAAHHRSIKKILRVVLGGPTAEDDGITASATARAWVTLDYPPPTAGRPSYVADTLSFRHTFKLVKFRGDWKVVGEVD